MYPTAWAVSIRTRLGDLLGGQNTDEQTKRHMTDGPGTSLALPPQSTYLLVHCQAEIGLGDI